MMLGETYAFVDGGYLLSEYRAAAAKWLGTDEVPPLDLGRLSVELSAQKLFFYDCSLHEPRQNEDAAAFERRKTAKRDELRIYQRTPNCHVREGVLMHRSGRDKRYEQKRVDVLLTVDALRHAVRGNFKTAVLVTGDQDFLPLVESLVEMGSHVHVRGTEATVAKDLADVADVFSPLTFDTLLNLIPEKARAAYPAPSPERGLNVPTALQYRGTCEDRPEVRIYGDHVGAGVSIYTICAMNPISPENLHVATRWAIRDLARAKLFAEEQYGVTNWSPPFPHA